MIEIAKMLIVIVVVAVIGTTTTKVTHSITEYKPDQFGCKFYDSGGNKIPVYAVKLLVRSEFEFMLRDEVDTIQKYFPRTRHLCPFPLCPMIDQVTFHGCGACDEGSDCYAIDSIHWEHPTWTYDQCEEYLMAPIRADSLITHH